jgi:hypothetical protein
VTVDEAFGQNRAFWTWLAAREVPFVLATRSDDALTCPDGRRHQAKNLIALAGEAVWERRSAGPGAHGERLYDWAVIGPGPHREKRRSAGRVGPLAAGSPTDRSGTGQGS